jgi:hypothetical protein
MNGYGNTTHHQTRTKEELEATAERAMLSMPNDLAPSELGYVLSLMMKGHALALKRRGF